MRNRDTVWALLLALVMMLALAVSPMAAAEASDPKTALTEGYYVFKFIAEGYGEQAFYFHFYPEDATMGSVFYAGLSNNRKNIVGTYTLEEAEYAYTVYPDRATEQSDADPTQGTVPYTITFFDWNGNVLGKCGFDGDILYNDMEEDSTIYSVGSAPYVYNHDTTGENAYLTDGELGVPFASFVAVDERTSTLEIYHNFTYLDLVDMMVEGTWTVAKNADGGFDFTLIPDDSMDDGAVVSVSPDRMACTYTPDGGDPIEMINPDIGAAKVAYHLDGTYRVEAYNMDAKIILNLYDDNTLAVIANVAGNERALDEGSYSIDGHTFVFDFAAGEDASSSVDGTGTVTVEYAIAGTAIGDVATTLTLVRE